jgi:hypothetical protein
MREVLAHPVAIMEYLVQWGMDRGRLRVVGKVMVDALCQVEHSGEQ